MNKYTALPTLLIITDKMITSVWLKKHLKSLFHIIQEETEEQTLMRLQNTTVDCVIVDSNIKDLQPASFLMKLKKVLSPNWIPILLITDTLKKSYRMRMIKAGATDFLNDPLQEEEVLNRVNLSLQTKERQQKIIGLSDVLKTQKKNRLEKISRKVVLEKNDKKNQKP